MQRSNVECCIEFIVVGEIFWFAGFAWIFKSLAKDGAVGNTIFFYEVRSSIAAVNDTKMNSFWRGQVKEESKKGMHFKKPVSFSGNPFKLPLLGFLVSSQLSVHFFNWATYNPTKNVP